MLFSTLGSPRLLNRLSEHKSCQRRFFRRVTVQSIRVLTRGQLKARVRTRVRTRVRMRDRVRTF
eukprot:1375917-Amorphochlora_amoeboformis.AAC.1